jgi:hypothetical protein
VSQSTFHLRGFLLCRGFDFGLPDNTVVQGIQVRVLARYSTTNVVTPTSGGLFRTNVAYVQYYDSVQARVRYLSLPPSLELPHRIVAREGTDQVLAPAHSGSPTPVYQWFKDEVRLAGETNVVLRLPAVGLSADGVYKLVGSNRLGTEQVETTLLVSNVEHQNLPFLSWSGSPVGPLRLEATSGLSGTNTWETVGQAPSPAAGERTDFQIENLLPAVRFFRLSGPGAGRLDYLNRDVVWLEGTPGARFQVDGISFANHPSSGWRKIGVFELTQNRQRIVLPWIAGSAFEVFRSLPVAR